MYYILQTSFAAACLQFPLTYIYFCVSAGNVTLFVGTVVFIFNVCVVLFTK